jgi:beta-N-acetylhexosaminidase
LRYKSNLHRDDKRCRSRLLILTKIVISILVLSLINPLIISHAAPTSQTHSSRERAMALLEGLQPEEIIGQLFLVTFEGSDIGPDSQIYDLIINHHIGGVILKAENDNFSPHPNTLSDLVQLNRSLQSIEWSASQSTQIITGTDQEFNPAFIPLFIGISQEGDGYPYDQILNGLSPLPSQMAIGATWNPEMAERVGAVVGKELSILGINLLLGPSLDVLETPPTRGVGDLGVRSFGGEPYWVGKMGKSFVQGVNHGSEGKIAIIAKHFPGFGSSNRLPEEEVATARKLLDSLKQIELPPFFGVTGYAETPSTTVDGLLTSHIRYQGFQGNIRETTRPVSLDPNAVEELMRLPALASWRADGGIMVSDDLGSRALLRDQIVPSRHVARDAFQAGNDLLYLGSDFVASTDPDSYTTIVNTLNFFTTKYREDAIFKQRVDESALRILTLKFRQYQDIFNLRQVQPQQDRLVDIGNDTQITLDIVQSATTLIHPSLSELAESLPESPGLNDRIVFITDARYAKQCSQCSEQPTFAVDALEQAVVRLYGPFAGGQVLQRNLSSYSFSDLIDLLDTTQVDEASQISTSLQQASWIVFSSLNVSINDPHTQALNRFLAEKPELYRQKKLIVFNFNAPYYLDATEISKLTAYYGLYTKNPQAIEVAARLLFGEIPFPPGALPVTVPGVDYDVISATAPNPDQVIDLRIDIPEPQDGDVSETPETPITFEIHDTLVLLTGLIRDQNGNPVPDGTMVEFFFRYGAEEFSQRETTRNGTARSTFFIDRSGALEIRVESQPAIQSQVIRLDIPADINTGPVQPTETIPTEVPTETPTATISPTDDEVPADMLRRLPSIGDWFLAVLLTGVFSSSIYLLTAQYTMMLWGLRTAFLTSIGGLLFYTYLALGLPGSQRILDETGSWGVLGITLTGAIIGWIVAWSWQKISGNNKLINKSVS